MKDRYLLPVFLVLLLALGLWVLKPFLVAILGAMVIAYIFYPLNKWLREKIKRRGAAALIVSVVIILLLTLPTGAIVNALVKEARLVYAEGKEILEGRGLEECERSWCGWIKRVGVSERFKENWERVLKGMTDWIIKKATGVIWGLPRMILNLFVTFFVVYYLLKEGDKLEGKLRGWRILEKHRRRMMKKIEDVVYSVIYGTVVVAALLAGLGVLIFYLLGVPSPWIWGLLIGFLAFIPGVGSSLVYGPAALYLLGKGYLIGSGVLMWKGVILLILGIVVISGVETFLKPKIIGSRAKVHPALVLVGILGGIGLMGLVGIVVGPLILVLAVTLMEVYFGRK